MEGQQVQLHQPQALTLGQLNHRQAQQYHHHYQKQHVHFLRQKQRKPSTISGPNKKKSFWRWAEKHDQLESRENRKTWVWIAEKISITLHSNKTADKCIRVFTLIGIFYFMVRVRFMRQRFCLWPISHAICLENSENKFIIVL